MSRQLAISSIMSALALASLCFASAGDMLGGDNAARGTAPAFGVQAEMIPGLHG